MGVICFCHVVLTSMHMYMYVCIQQADNGSHCYIDDMFSCNTFAFSCGLTLFLCHVAIEASRVRLRGNIVIHVRQV